MLMEFFMSLPPLKTCRLRLQSARQRQVLFTE